MNDHIKNMAGEFFTMMPPSKELEEYTKYIARYCSTICNTVSGDKVDNASRDYQEGREMGAIVCRNQIIKTFGI